MQEPHNQGPPKGVVPDILYYGHYRKCQEPPVFASAPGARLKVLKLANGPSFVFSGGFGINGPNEIGKADNEATRRRRRALRDLNAGVQ
jgi:hypothetical protein